MKLNLDGVSSLSSTYGLNPHNIYTMLADMLDMSQLENSPLRFEGDDNWSWDFALDPNLYMLENVEIGSDTYMLMLNAIAFSGMMQRATVNVHFHADVEGVVEKIQIILRDDRSKTLAGKCGLVGDIMHGDLLHYFQSALMHEDVVFRVHKPKDGAVHTVAFEADSVLDVYTDKQPEYYEYGITFSVHTDNVHEFYSEGESVSTVELPPIPVSVDDEEYVVDVARLSNILLAEGPTSKLMLAIIQAIHLWKYPEEDRYVGRNKKRTNNKTARKTRAKQRKAKKKK